jgi:hypothetical protein
MSSLVAASGERPRKLAKAFDLSDVVVLERIHRSGLYSLSRPLTREYVDPSVGQPLVNGSM